MSLDIDPSLLSVDPKTNEPFTYVESYPWSNQDFAFNQICVAFGLNEAMIEELTPKDKQYWAALTEAVASCNLVDPNNTVHVMGTAEIINIHQTALESQKDVRYLQEFAIHAKRERSQLLAGRPFLLEPDPSRFYGSVVNSFTLPE